MNKIFEDIKKDMLKREESLSVYACKSKDAIFLKEHKIRLFLQKII